MMISFLIPTLRKDRIEELIHLITTRQGGSYAFEILTDSEPGGVNQAVNRLVKKAQGEYLCVLGDDTIPQEGFIKHALEEMKVFEGGWGLVAFNDGTGRPLATHFIVHRKVLTILGEELLHSGYKHLYADNEITDRLSAIGRVIYSQKAVVIHDHPLLNGKGEEAFDDIYKRAYGECRVADHDLYSRRKRKHFFAGKGDEPTTVAVCLPCGDLVPVDFMRCLLHLCFYSDARGIRVIFIEHRSSLVEVGRAQLVESAKDAGAQYMLFLDSDMWFPPDILVRMLKHKKDVVCTDAARRRPPFDTVVHGLDDKKLDHSQTGLVEIKGVSTGVCLIDMDVFDKIERPYFLVTYKDGGFLGEDYYFSYKIKEQGVQVWCDLDISKRIGHIGQKTYFIQKEAA